MTDVSFDLPDEVVNEARGAMADQTITLPFPAPTVWWRNGAKSDKQIGGVRYFGGWAISIEDLDLQGLEYPPNFSVEEWVNREGGEFGVACLRAFGFAAISKRKQWTQSSYGGWRSHIQVLGIMAILNGEIKYEPYGPVVLSAKGYAGKSLEDALRKWDQATREGRREYANNYPAWLFYAPVGTFGNEPNIEQWGSSQKSPGTPVSVWLPEKITHEHLLNWYVGNEMALQMNEYRAQAQEWVDAWKKQDKQDNGNGSAVDQFNAAMSDDEIPF